MKVLFGGIIALSLATPASASFWFYEKKESAFGDEVMHVGATGNMLNGRGIVLKCSQGKSSLVYIVKNTDMTDDAVSKANGLGVFRLLVRVDKNEAYDFPAMGRMTDIADIAIEADIEPALMKEMKDASKTVAVAVAVTDHRFWEESFSADGSTEVVGKVIDGCKH